MIAAAHALTADQWLWIAAIAVPISYAILGGWIRNLRKQVTTGFHDLHHHARILDGESGVGPGLIYRVEQLEKKR